MLKYKYIFQIKYTEAILSNSARKLLWLETTKMLIADLKNKFIVLFIIIFGTLSFPSETWNLSPVSVSVHKRATSKSRWRHSDVRRPHPRAIRAGQQQQQPRHSATQSAWTTRQVSYKPGSEVVALDCAALQKFCSQHVTPEFRHGDSFGGKARRVVAGDAVDGRVVCDRGRTDEHWGSAELSSRSRAGPAAQQTTGYQQLRIGTHAS